MSDDADAVARAAQGPDRDAFAGLAEPLRSELLAHCYRMLGSLHDAEDIVQEAFLRAWRAFHTFEPRAPFRSWLYRITTNACLDLIRVRPRRTFPPSVYPAANPLEPTGEQADEFRWLEPFPDAALPHAPDGPEARYARREGMSVAFIVALQRLPGTQRAVLILRDVLDFRASEVAEVLTMTIPAVNSALHRARVTMAAHHVTEGASPRPSDRQLLGLVNEFVDAMEAGDLPRVLATLTTDAKWIMPPLSAWYQGRDAIATFIATRVFAARVRGIARRRIVTWANGQPALAVYHQASARRVYEAFALQVLTIEAPAWRISEVTTFLNTDVFRAFGLAREIPM